LIDTTPAAPHDAAPSRTHAETQELVLRTVAREAESLLRTARRHSLCADDAHDAYQRSMEILVRRAPTLDPERAARWLHVVVKHEAMALRKGRSEVVSPEAVDFELHEAVHVPSPEEQAIGADRTARAAEALQRLKPHELQAMWLKALGKSYAEICDETGWSHTKLNRCLAEGRKTFLQRFAGIETGEECTRWQPVLSAMVDGEATAAQLTELRPHLRNCPSCRATVRGLHEARAPLAAVLPVGLLGAGAKLGGLLDRVMPAAAAGDAGLTGGGAGLLGVGGTKLAGLVAAGAAATAGGGGLVVAHEHHAASVKRARPAVQQRVAARRADVLPVSAALGGAGPFSSSTAPGGADRPTDRQLEHGGRATRRSRLRLTARRRHDGRVEFRPAGGTVTRTAAAAAESVTLERASQGAQSSAGPASPVAGSASAAAPEPVLPAPASSADSTSGEFAPRP
jgi:RNA polymerase sigma factor (sigma-70 family)